MTSHWTDTIHVGVAGAAGRMGRRVIRLLGKHTNLRLSAALDGPQAAAGAPDVGDLAGVGRLGVSVTCDPGEAVACCDVLIDFSAPPACATLAPLCGEGGVAYIVASTALTDAHQEVLDRAAQSCAVLQAANLSTGVNVLLELVELASRRLGGAFDVEIGEIHHRHKRDAPSGTAFALGAAARRGRDDLTDVLRRDGIGEPRTSEQLGYAALRGGDVAGEHTVYFFGDGERLELVHRSGSADIFAAGALRAAVWLAGRAPGRYDMRDLLRHREPA